MSTPPYKFIAIARTIARGFTEQAIGHPDGEALTEAALAIWRGIGVLEGMERRTLPGEARSMRSVRRALSAAWFERHGDSEQSWDYEAMS